MATATLFVDSDVTANWDTTFPASPTTHYTKVDEGTGSPDDADYNETTTNNDIDEYGFQDTPANVSQVTQVTVVVRAKLTDVSSTALIRVSLWRSGPTQVGSNVDLNGASFGGYGAGPNPANAVFGSLTLTKAQADTLSVRFEFRTA